MIDDVLPKLSENCLRGQPVPAALRVLWEAHLSGQSPIGEVEYGEVELVSEYDAKYFEGYDAEFCGNAAIARAFDRMFRQIAFIGREADGGLIGYWLRDEGDEIERAPIVLLDNEGQFHCTATTLQDHFVQSSSDPPEVASIRGWFQSRGIETCKSPEAVWELVAGLPDPNKIFDGYQSEEAGQP